MREKVGVKVVRALKRNNDGVSHAAIDMLCALMQVISVYSLLPYVLYFGHNYCSAHTQCTFCR